jgi:hypothetical protein
VLFSKDNLDGSARNHNETMLRGGDYDYAYKQTYGLRPDRGMRRGDICINQTKHTTQHGKPRISFVISSFCEKAQVDGALLRFTSGLFIAMAECYLLEDC